MNNILLWKLSSFDIQHCVNFDEKILYLPKNSYKSFPAKPKPTQVHTQNKTMSNQLISMLKGSNKISPKRSRYHPQRCLFETFEKTKKWKGGWKIERRIVDLWNWEWKRRLKSKTGVDSHLRGREYIVWHTL